MMDTINQKLEEFFDAYEKRFNDAITTDKVDVDATAHAFADCFVEASPKGIICGKNDEEFKINTKKGYAFYKSVGTQSMKIVKKEINLLNEWHSLVKIYWKTDIIKKDKSEISIEFNVFYLVQILNGQIKIFAYITEDEEKAFKDNQLEPYIK